MDKHYTITGRNEIYTAGTDKVTFIGQLNGSDIKLPNQTQYVDETFAKIVPNREGDGWHLVKITRHWPILVNGVEMNRVHYLADGDIIDFPDYNCRFNIRDGRQALPSVIHIHKNTGHIWGIVVALVVIASVVAYRIYDTARDNITSHMQNEIEASLFMITVDSLQLMKNTEVIDSYSYASNPIGTAFLTTDSLIVTARHCIQPWLNRVKPYEYSQIPSIADWPVAMALLAETENQLADTAEYKIISYMTLTDQHSHSFQIDSEQFAINYDFDEIVELGNYFNTQYWRSISHRYQNQDMMLGDIAVAKHNKAGNISVADVDDLRRLFKHKRTNLTFFGYPESGVNGNQLDCQNDELRIPIKELDSNPDHIFMLAHGGILTPGFSGGPVIVRDGIGFKAVGVISVVDEKNSHRSYSVPTSELRFLRK